MLTGDEKGAGVCCVNRLRARKNKGNAARLDPPVAEDSASGLSLQVCLQPTLAKCVSPTDKTRNQSAVISPLHTDLRTSAVLGWGPMI